MRFKPTLTTAFSTNFILATVSLTFFLLTSPIALQKTLSLKVLDEQTALFEDAYSEVMEREVSELLDAIPYKNDPSESWFVKPQSKYEDTILGGNGNCSNLAFGAMYAFNRSEQQAAVLHLLLKDYSQFLHGAGHTVLLVNQDGNSTIVDILEGGVPLQNGNVIDVQNFNLNQSDLFSHQSLNTLKDGDNPYFTTEFLSQVEFGVIPQIEVLEYFRFIDAIYVPLGSIYLEKLFFDTLALAFGQFPNTYVSSKFFLEIYKNSMVNIFFAFLFLFSFHLTYITFVLVLVKKLRAFRS
tara:strand:- start:796 stop:1683 length:888 start_codon:yes stop_codon:yes gene_type:complete